VTKASLGQLVKDTAVADTRAVAVKYRRARCRTIAGIRVHVDALNTPW
jgi:hypothetical protein